jgi:hypothetical protein
LFHQLAAGLASDRGQTGILVGAMVVLATIAVQVVLFGQDSRAAVRGLGLGFPTSRGVIAALTIGLLIGLVIPLWCATCRSSSTRAGWDSFPASLPKRGPEEILFRGYLFRHVRASRPFWRAVLLSLAPFAAVHVPRRDVW